MRIQKKIALKTRRESLSLVFNGRTKVTHVRNEIVFIYMCICTRESSHQVSKRENKINIKKTTEAFSQLAIHTDMWNGVEIEILTEVSE